MVERQPPDPAPAGSEGPVAAPDARRHIDARRHVIAGITGSGARRILSLLSSALRSIHAGNCVGGIPLDKQVGFPLRQNPLIRPEAIVLTSSDRRKPFNVHPEPRQLVGPEVCTVGPEVRTVTRPMASRSVRPDASIFFSLRLMMRTSPGRRRLPRSFLAAARQSSTTATGSLGLAPMRVETLAPTGGCRSPFRLINADRDFHGVQLPRRR
jgi:hypothetical protein